MRVCGRRRSAGGGRPARPRGGRRRNRLRGDDRVARDGHDPSLAVDDDELRVCAKELAERVGGLPRRQEVPHDDAAAGLERCELRKADAELRTLMETVPAVIWLAHDPEASRITGSRFAAELLRLGPADNQSLSAPPGERPTHYRILRNEEEVPIAELPLQRAARGEIVRNEELRVVFDDGSYFDELVSAAPVRGMTFDTFVRLERGMTEGELLIRAGAPDHQSLDGYQDYVVKTFYYLPTLTDPFTTVVRLRGGRIANLQRIRRF